jgi:hypothetical protein
MSNMVHKPLAPKIITNSDANHLACHQKLFYRLGKIKYDVKIIHVVKC